MIVINLKQSKYLTILIIAVFIGFTCCYRINVTGENSRISEYHKSTLGIYTRVRERLEDGFTAPVYKKGLQSIFNYRNRNPSTNKFLGFIEHLLKFHILR